MPASEYDALLESQPTQQKSEYDSLLTQPAQSKEQGGVLSGIAAGIWRAVPKSLGQIAGFIGAGGPSDIQELLQTGRIIGDVVHGASPEQAVRKEAPDVAQQQDVLLGRYGAREQAAGITGLGIQAGMLALPALAKIPSLRETVFGKTEPLAAETAAEEVKQSATQERQIQESIPAERPRDDTGRTPAEAGRGGGIRPTAEVQPQAQVEPTVPQPEQPRILSTAVQREGQIFQGQSPTDMHADIGTQHGIGEPPESERGFIVQNPDGTTRFVGREEGGTIADQAGQRPQQFGGQPLASEHLQGREAETKIGGAGEEKRQEDEGQRREGVLTPQQELPSTEAAAVSGAETPPAAALHPSDPEPVVSQVANRFVEERVARGELGAIAPGQGHSTMELLQRGLKMTPEEINQHISNLMQRSGGDPVEQASAVRAEESRLSQRSAQLSREAEADPSNVDKKLAADNAFKDVTDFHNGPSKRIDDIFHGVGMSKQGAIPIDLSTFNGIREKWLKDTGTLPPPDVEPVLRKTSQRLSDANGEANGSRKALGDAIDKESTRRKYPGHDEVANNILERLKSQTPC